MSPLEPGAPGSPVLYYWYRLAPRSAFEYVSPSVTAVVGYTPEEHYADPLLGFKLIHPDDAATYAGLLQSPAAAARPVVLRWRRRHGGVLWTASRARPVYDRRGRWVAVETLAVDITAACDVTAVGRTEASAGTAGAVARRLPLLGGVGGASEGVLLTGHIEELPEVTIARLEGEVDISNAATFRVYLSRAARAGRPVVVDLTRLQYFDASGLHAIEDYIHLCRQHELRTVLVPSRLVHRLLTIAGLDRALALAASVPEALRLIAQR